MDDVELERLLLEVLRENPPGADAAHDLGHLQRVLGTARRISEPGADALVLTAASLLHDCVSVPKDSPDRSRASAMSAGAAAQILRCLGFPEDRIPDVRHAIEAHSYSAGIVPTTPEARAVQDADRIEALGAIGIARCFAVSGSMGRALFDPEDPLSEHRDPDEGRWGLDHFQTKLLKLPGTMHTEKGRELAQERAGVLRDFMRQLAHEAAAAS